MARVFRIRSALFLKIIVFPCHSSQSRMGGLVLETRTDLLKGGAHGAVIAPGDPERSRLVGMLEGKIVPRMPLNGELSATEIEAVKAWIHSGAPGGMGTESLAAAPGGAIPDIQPTVDVSAQVGALAFSSDGRWLAVAGYQNVRVMNPRGPFGCGGAFRPCRGGSQRGLQPGRDTPGRRRRAAGTLG